MCELFAMSSRQPATVNLSLGILAQHGGATGPHKDGWGIAYYEDGDVRLVKEKAAASRSDWIDFIEAHDLHSRIVISHIRLATMGERLLKNTQPFCRELGGQLHVFAHNGHLKNIWDVGTLALGGYRPVGDTDSEYAFCVLLARLQEVWLSSTGVPALADRLRVVADFAAELRPLGPANFIYADGQTVFGHGNKRRHSDGAMRPPGLCMLRRRCPAEAPSLSGSGIAIDLPEQEVALLASVPLTDEAWTPLAEGEVIAIEDAAVLSRESA